MSNEQKPVPDPARTSDDANRVTRRQFLMKLSLAIPAAAILGLGLSGCDEDERRRRRRRDDYERRRRENERRRRDEERRRRAEEDRRRSEEEERRRGR